MTALADDLRARLDQRATAMLLSTDDLLGDLAPDVFAALRAVLDLCDQRDAATGQRGLVVTSAVRDTIAARLGVVE